MRTTMIALLSLLSLSACDPDSGGAGGSRDAARSEGTSSEIAYGEAYTACDADYLAWFPDVPDDAVVSGYTCHAGSLEGEAADICPDAVVNRIPGHGVAVECGTTASSAGVTWIAPSG